MHCPTHEYFGLESGGYPKQYLWSFLLGNRDSLDLCTGCGMCSARCPLDIDIPRLVSAARSGDLAKWPMMMKNRLLHDAWPLMQAASAFGPLVNLALDNKLVRMALEGMSGYQKDVWVPRVRCQTFNQRIRARRTARAGQQEMGDTIIYYHGCFVNYFDHETGAAVVEVLEKNGFKVEVPELICCSFPLLNSGDLPHARRRASELTDMLANFAAQGCDIVYSCPTCGYALKEIFPTLLESEAARLVAAKTSLVTSYLLELHRAGKLKVAFGEKPLRIAYHTPCHLRSQDLSAVSAELLALIPGVDIRDLDRGCCGMGGTWALHSKGANELSREIGAAVFGEIEESQPQVVSTDCAGCQIQIARCAELPGERVIHPMRILAEAYAEARAEEEAE
jgi:Fe-S oxidoreductase